MVREGEIYELKLFDRTLAAFSFGVDDPVTLIDFDETASALFPLGIEMTGEGLWKWLSTRAIPQNRRFAAQLCRSLGLSTNDRSGIMAASLGLSLNDSYWITPKGFAGTFAECNLFRNDFSAVLAAVAYTGVVSDQHGLTPSTPELTTNGALRKAWRIEEDGTRRLYKGSSDDRGEYGEARAEFLASQVAEAMGLHAVRYDLGQWSRQDAAPCSICSCFCTEEVSYVPHALAFGDASHGAAARSMLLWGAEQFERYASMMVFDSLIYNTDRHLTNFGVLRESRTGRLIEAAPVFDNGRSLFFNSAFSQVGDFASEARFVSPSWAQVTFDEQAARLIGGVQKRQLARLTRFEFCNSDGHPFPEAFLRALSAFIRRRAEELSKLPEVDREALMRKALGAGA